MIGSSATAIAGVTVLPIYDVTNMILEIMFGADWTKAASMITIIQLVMSLLGFVGSATMITYIMMHIYYDMRYRPNLIFLAIVCTCNSIILLYTLIKWIIIMFAWSLDA